MNRAKGWVRALGLVAMFAFAQSAGAVTCISVASGNWSSLTTWGTKNNGCVGTKNGYPGGGDIVTLASPFTVTLDRSYSATDLTINTGASLNDNGNTLTVSGNVINNGSFGVAGGRGGGRLSMTGAGTTISGTGTFADSRLYIDANVTLPATSTMNFTAGAQIRVGKNAAGTFTIAGTITDVGATAGNRILRVYGGSTVTVNGALNTPNSYAEIQAGGAVVNNGIATLQYLMGGNATTSIWTNAANSTLNVSGAVCATACMLNASAAGNTVNYNGAAQTVYVPSGSTYTNLMLSGSGAVTVPTGLTVAGNFTMSGTSTVAAPAALAVGGDFIIGAGNAFTPGTGTVTLNGASVQTIGGGTTDLSFNNLTVSNTAGITLARNVVVTGTLTGTVVLTSTCPADFTLKVGVTVLHSCSSATAANFDCVESGVTYTPNPVTPARNPLYTKLAGTAFSFDVVALKVDGTVETNFAKSVTVELVDTSVAGACASYPVLATAVSQTLKLAAGKATTANMTVANSYPSLGCRVTDKSVTPNVVGCSADKFSVRPVSLTLSATGLGADATGASTTNTPAVKAGANFTLTATASDAGYTGTPTLDNAQLVAHTGAVRNGKLGGTFGAAIAGTASGVAFTYDDAGYFKLKANGLLDATFTAADSAAGDCTPDFSITLVGGKYGCKVGSAAAGYFGRFTPDHFDTAVTHGCAGCGYTYSGQAYAVQVTAMNGLATPAKTSNYDTTGGYSRAVTLADANAGATPAGVLASATIAATAFASGTAAATPSYTFGVSMTAPAVVKMRANDAEVTTPGVNEGTTEIRSGRIKVANAHGSELLALPMTAAVQYYNGANWVGCATDNTTTFNTALVAAGGNVSPVMVSGPLAKVAVQNANANPVVKGAKTITLAKPGVALSVDLSLSAPAYLLAGSNGAGVNPSLPGRAVFSVYKGNHNFIYQREAY